MGLISPVVQKDHELHPPFDCVFCPGYDPKSNGNSVCFVYHGRQDGEKLVWHPPASIEELEPQFRPSSLSLSYIRRLALLFRFKRTCNQCLQVSWRS